MRRRLQREVTISRKKDCENWWVNVAGRQRLAHT